MIKASFNVRNAKNEIIFSIPIKAKTTMIVNPSGGGKTRFVEFLRFGEDLFGFKLSIDFEHPFKKSKPATFIYYDLFNSDLDTIKITKDPDILFLVDVVSNLPEHMLRELYRVGNPILLLGRPPGFNETDFCK